MVKTNGHRATAAASRAIELSLRGETFKVNDVRCQLSDPPSRQTIYRVLRQLESDDWVQQDGKHWEPDIKAELLSDVNQRRSEKQGLSFDAEELLEGG